MSFDLVGGSGFLTADDKQLEYRIFGRSRGATPFIVLMHEGLGCLSLWRDFPQRVVEATGLPVLAYSRAGYGHSQSADLPRPLDYMTREATVPQRWRLPCSNQHMVLLSPSVCTLAGFFITHDNFFIDSLPVDLY